MPDYGLPLLFGTFLTPGNAHPDATVALAQLAEQSGLDLVSFQDHPYQPAFLDTWTLLSWVAARTESIHVAPNVMSLPMRPPAVTARAAASLDLLSNGRFDLGLGAGGFWDAIHAMGGRRLTPGQSVDALSEAIDVIRGIWNVDDRAPLRLEGEYYELDGAKRGPQPAHDIPIWLGAYKPRMLRLTGRKADGWLPSLPYMQPGDVAAGNAIIDEAALAAGRDPREIRRLLNIGGRFTATNGGPLVGPPEQWVEELLPYALDDGIATFIVMGDDPLIIQRFAAEVAPALREAVDRERATSGVVQGVVRRASALALRRDGIDYDAIPPSLAAAAVEPGDNGYSRVRSTYMRGGSPGLVLRASTPDEVVDALRYARSQPVEFGIRSGGHGISGRSTNDGGIIIDVSRLDSVEVLDEETRTVRIGPGARWVDVAASLSQHGWALSSGDYGGVGVGGLATAGGIGWLAREHGLTIDHLTAVELVLADGTITRASADENPDLFWAMRGAGANFGIATAFEFRVDEVGDVGFVQLVFDATDVAGLLERWGAAVEAAPRDLTSFLILTPARRGQPAIAHTMTVVDSSDPETIIQRLEPLAAIAPLLDQSVQLLPYAAVMANTSGEPHHRQGEPVARTGFIEHITEEFAQATADLIATGATHFFQLRSVGGAVSDVPADATAYAYRSANFCVAVFGSDPGRLDGAMKSMTELFHGMYLSFSTEISVDKAFPPEALERLRAVKGRYDPENVFRDNFNVAPLIPAMQV